VRKWSCFYRNVEYPAGERERPAKYRTQFTHAQAKGHYSGRGERIGSSSDLEDAPA
jgi:hypothetical protein